MFNIGSIISENNPDIGTARAAGPGLDTWTGAAARSRIANSTFILVLTTVLIDYLANLPRRIGARLFAMNDAEADWRGWQTINTYAGLGRRYRDPRFDTLCDCPHCQGTGSKADQECPACLGTGCLTGSALAGADGYDGYDGELAMASGRPRRRNDPSVLASVETAVRTVTRPGTFGLIWHWRYELALITGPAGIAFAVDYTAGVAWLIAAAAIGTTILTAAVLWPRSRRRLIARAWCVITPHRVRTGCTHAWVQSRDGRLPALLRTTPTVCGERLLLWCRAGITAADLDAARDIISAACWAREVRVIPDERHGHIVTLEVIRRGLGVPPGVVPAAPSWPQLNPLPHSKTDSLDSEEPVLPPRADDPLPRIDDALPLGAGS
jgi:hypothetical protein